MSIFKRKPKVGGEIEYFGLADWWLSVFSKEQRKYIEEVYQPLGAGDHPLTAGKIVSASGTAVGLLVPFAGWFQKSGDWPITSHILYKAEEELEKLLQKDGQSVIRLHYIYSQMIRPYYRFREVDPKAFDGAINSCERQIAIADKAARTLAKGTSEN